jgi:Cytochrome c oxidase subunit IIa family
MEEPHPKPTGTIAVLIVYAALSLALWGSVYLTLLFRGSTQ